MKSWAIVILPYMVSEMKLNGNELISFAFINGFCNGAGHGWQGNLDTAAEHCGMSKKTIQRCFESLVKKGYVQKLQAKTVIEANDKKFVNTLPLYVTKYSEGEKLEVKQDTDVEAGNNTDTESGYKIDDDVELPMPAMLSSVEIIEDRNVSTENEKKDVVEKPIKKSKTEKKVNKDKDTRFQEVKDYFLEVYKTVYPGNRVTTNSALINKRLKELFNSGVSPLQMKYVFKEMVNDDFCKNKLKFELAPLLSDTVFNKWFNFTSSKYKKLKEDKKREELKNIKVVEKCTKCGRELYNGLCCECDIDKIISNMGR